jgi:hypothetical protein
VEAGQLQEGDVFRSHDGQTVVVEAVIDNGEEGLVYNLQIEECSTYFIGCEEWGFSVWAHNQCTADDVAQLAKLSDVGRQKYVAGEINSGDQNRIHAVRAYLQKRGVDPDVVDVLVARASYRDGNVNRSPVSNEINAGRSSSPLNEIGFGRQRQIERTVSPNEMLEEVYLDPMPTKRPLSSPFYSNWFDAKLQQGTHFPGQPDGVHFREANRQLWNRMQADPGFARGLEAEHPGITAFLTPGPRGGFPETTPASVGLTWHHSTPRKGIVELVPIDHHRAPGPVQNTLHPNQQGGMEVWGGGRRQRRIP